MDRKELRSQSKYRKIYTIFERDEKFKVVEGVINPKLEGIRNIKEFVVSEKIDGTNCCIVLTPKKEILIRKRSDFIEDDKDHHHYFEAIKGIDMQKIKDYFEDSKSLIAIFGEACGGNIQKQGKTYSDKPTFRLFDIRCGNNFFDWDDLIEFSKFTGIPLVEWFKFEGKDILDYNYWLSFLKEVNKKKYVEGYVIRSRPALLNKFSQRMMFKIKLKDYREAKNNKIK